MPKQVITQGILYDAAGNVILDLTQSPAAMTIPSGATLTNDGTISGGTVSPNILAARPVLEVKSLNNLTIRPNHVIDPLFWGGLSAWGWNLTTESQSLFSVSSYNISSPGRLAVESMSNSAGSTTVPITAYSTPQPAAANQTWMVSTNGAFSPNGGIGVTAYVELSFWDSDDSSSATKLAAFQSPAFSMLGNHEWQSISGTAPTNTAYVTLALVIEVPSGVAFNGGWWAWPKLEVSFDANAVPSIFSNDMPSPWGIIQFPPQNTSPAASGALAYNGSNLTLGNGTSALSIPPTNQESLVGSGTFTVPDGIYQLWIQLWGGGGGGSGGNYDDGSGGNGGGAGGYIQTLLPVSPGQSINYSVGVGGVGGTAGVYETSPTPGNGVNGGSSSFASIAAYGGDGAPNSTGSSVPGGSTSTSGLIAVANDGGSGSLNSGGVGGSGGATVGGTGSPTPGGYAGNPSGGPGGNGSSAGYGGGGGGNGATGSNNPGGPGGNGANGACVVTY